MQFTRSQRILLVIFAVTGLIGPNGIFLYFALTDRAALLQALHDPVAMVFMGEAFLLLVLFAWLIKIRDLTRPGWLTFTVLSLLGSMAFSVPAFLLLHARKEG